MREPKPVQKPAAFCVFRNGNHRPPVLICKPEPLLDCAHYSDTSQVWLQLGSVIGEIFTIFSLAYHADNASLLAIQKDHDGAHGAGDRTTIIFLEIELRGWPAGYLRRLLARSIDSITAKAANRVAGLGADASKHILESVSQSPPKEKSSS